MSLSDPTLKMSKSHADSRSRIHLNDSPDQIGYKIRLALTDSVAGVSFDPQTRPGVSNLLSIMSSLDSQGRSPQELAQSFASLSMRGFKNEVTAGITSALAGISERYQDLVKEGRSSYLDDVAREGAKKARRKAKMTMTMVRESIGLC